MRIFLALILTLCVYADSTQDHYPSYESTANSISGTIEFSAECAKVENKAEIRAQMEEQFPQITGAAVLRKGNTVEFSLDINGAEGIPEDMAEDDYAEVKARIEEAFPCPVTVVDIEALSSELLMGPTSDDRRRRHLERFNNKRRNLYQLPFAKSYVDTVGPIRDQGNAGSCASHSMDTVLTHYNTVANDKTVPYSTKFFYYMRCMIEQNDFSSPCGSGMVASWLGDSLQTYGVVPEEDYPYVNESDNDYEDEIPQNLKTQALDIIPEYQTTNGDAYNWICYEPSDIGTPEDFKLYTKINMNEYGPMLIAVWVYRHNQCDIWNSHNGRKLGGHAMNAVSYDEDGLMIRNSWGTSWCDDGMHPMTWEDAYERAWEWCFYERPAAGEETLQFCDDKADWTDRWGNTCADYKTEGWCENCEEGSNWSSSGFRGSPQFGSNCDQSCGCCTGDSMSDVEYVTSVDSSESEEQEEYEEEVEDCVQICQSECEATVGALEFSPTPVTCENDYRGYAASVLFGGVLAFGVMKMLTPNKEGDLYRGLYDNEI